MEMGVPYGVHCHTPKITHEWFKKHDKEFKLLTPNSPDLYLLQHLWDVLLRQHLIPQYLKDLLIISWCQIPQLTFRELALVHTSTRFRCYGWKQSLLWQEPLLHIQAHIELGLKHWLNLKSNKIALKIALFSVPQRNAPNCWTSNERAVYEPFSINNLLTWKQNPLTCLK